ncbi:hypothetical protein [Emticicia fontis]
MRNSFGIFDIQTDNIDTVESFRGKIFRKGDKILIPIINVGISEHTLNGSKNLQFIDYSYLLFQEVISLEWNVGYIAEDLFYIGATNIVSDEQGELAIKCSRAYIVLKAESKVSTNMWIPVNTPNFRPNLNIKDIEYFLNDNFESALQAICLNFD